MRKQFKTFIHLPRHDLPNIYLMEAAIITTNSCSKKISKLLAKAICPITYKSEYIHTDIFINIIF